MRLVAGLGNPGREYDGTRHNIGFDIVDVLASQIGATPWKAWKKGLVAKGKLGDEDLVLLKPQTFMNLSGDSVSPALSFYKLPPEHLIVVHDELDFELGDVRLKFGGGHGGHNGLRSIMNSSGRDFGRLRIGVGRPPKGWEGAKWVLSRFRADEEPLLDEATVRTCEAIGMIVKHGFSAAMNKFNRRSDKPNGGDPKCL